MNLKCVWRDHAECDSEDCGCVCHFLPGVNVESAPHSRSFLSAKQAKISALVAEGYGPQQIARELHTSEQTVKNVLRIIYRKIGIAKDSRICQIVRLGVWWNCELFQLGLTA